MMDKKELNDLLIVRFLSGQSSPEESREVIEWLNADHKNRKLYFHLKRMWQEDAIKEIDEEHISDSWDRIRLRIEKPEFGLSAFKDKQSVLWSLKGIAVAASILLLAGTSMFLGLQNYHNSQLKNKLNHISVPLGSRSNLILPDGSSVWLNAGSKLTYSSKFGSSERSVTLVGEGFFDVKHDNNSPFYVKAGELKIKVLGTRFNVKSYPEEKVIETTLVNGMVEINAENEGMKSRSIILEPNQKLTYTKSEASMSIASTGESNKESTKAPKAAVQTPSTFKITQRVDPDASTSWKDGKLIFEGESIASLAPKLERFYNVNITIQDESIRDYKYTGTLQEVTIEEVLRAIARTSSIRFEIEKNKVILKKSKCMN